MRENLPGRMELFELPILKSGDLNSKAYLIGEKKPGIKLTGLNC